MAARSCSERRTRRRKKKNVPPPPKEMCSTSSPTGWCHCHHDTTSALCRAEPRSVSALSIERRCRSVVWVRKKVRCFKLVYMYFTSDSYSISQNLNSCVPKISTRVSHIYRDLSSSACLCPRDGRFPKSSQVNLQRERERERERLPVHSLGASG